MGTYNKEKYYYFMLKSNFFDNDVLKYLQSEPNGYEKIILYFKLIFKTINKDGYLIKKVGFKKIPYTIKELSTETNHSEELINEAIDYFMDTGMIEKRDDKYYIEDALILTNQTTVGAMNMREYRIKNPDKSKPKCKNKCKPNSKVYIDNKNNKHNLEIITNKKEIEINKKEYQDIIDYLNYKTHSNFILIDEYKKLISKILKKYTINDIKTVIDKKTSEWINNLKMKPYLTPETLHDILDKTKTLKNNYYLSILEQMKKDGYFRLEVVPLSPEQEDRNYGKSIKWIERGIIPGFLLEDMQKYINKSSNKLNGNDKKYLE